MHTLVQPRFFLFLFTLLTELALAACGGGYRMTRNFEGRMGMQDPTWPMGPGLGMMNGSKPLTHLTIGEHND